MKPFNQKINLDNQLTESSLYRNLLDFYKPNFVLVSNQKTFLNSSLFGNILNFYKNEEANFLNFTLFWNILVNCLSSLSQRILNKLSFGIYLFLLFLAKEVSLLPLKQAKLTKTILELIQTLQNNQTREIWLVSFKLLIKKKIKLFN
jgi:hypothetical protein